MLRLSIFEFFLRAIPESFLFVLAGYVFTETTINTNKYLISSILLSIAAYVIRLLPIQYGVNAIISLIVLIVLLVSLNKIDIIKSIKVAIFIVILESTFEAIDVFIIRDFLKQDLNVVSSNPSLKIIYEMPSLLLFGLSTILYYIIFSRKRREIRNN